jgi:hypothetical protein
MTARGRHRVFLLAMGWALAVGAAAFAPKPCAATSIYSAGGLGEPQLEEGARIRALGGAGVAEFGVDRFSQVNPASMAGVKHLIIQGTIVPAFRRAAASGLESENEYKTEIPSLRALVLLPARIAIGASYGVMTDAQFEIDRTESAGTGSALHIQGTGGIQTIRLSVARALTPGLRVGADYEIIAGNFREEWERDFADTNLATSRDTLESRYERQGRWRLGAQASVGKWTLGGVYELERRLPLTSIERAAGTTTEIGGKNLIIPSGFVLGASGPVAPRWALSAQYRRANWERASLASDLVDFRASERYSVGLERLGSREDNAKWRARLPLRVGFSYLQWPDLLPLAGSASIASGTARVKEWAFSLGTGFATEDKAGIVDLSLEAGKRGDQGTLGVSETFFRAALTLQIGDDSWK